MTSSGSLKVPNGKDEPAEAVSQQSLQQLAGQTIFAEFERKFLSNLVLRAAEFRSCKGYFPARSNISSIVLSGSTAVLKNNSNSENKI